MVRSTLFSLALVSALVFHINPACALLDDFLDSLNSRYDLQNDAGLRATLKAFEAILDKHEGKTAEELFQEQECRKAAAFFFSGCIRVGVPKESDPEIKGFLLKVLAFIDGGQFEAVLKDSAQWPALEEYLKTWGKSKPPPAFKSGTVQTAGFTSGFLVTCFVTSLVSTQ